MYNEPRNHIDSKMSELLTSPCATLLLTELQENLKYKSSTESHQANMESKSVSKAEGKSAKGGDIARKETGQSSLAPNGRIGGLSGGTAAGAAGSGGDASNISSVSHGTSQRAHLNAKMLSPGDVMTLQRSIGNLTLQRLLDRGPSSPKSAPPNQSSTPQVRTTTGSPTIQRKMMVGPVNDSQDSLLSSKPARQKGEVVKMPAPIQRKVGVDKPSVEQRIMRDTLIQRTGGSNLFGDSDGGDVPTTATTRMRSGGGGSLFGEAEEAERTGKVIGIRDVSVARLSFNNPTWDPNAYYMVGDKQEKGGAWVEATAERGAIGSRSNLAQPGQTAKHVDKRMVAGATLDPSQANAKLLAGRLNEHELAAITTQQVAQVNPLGEHPRNILKHMFHESWHHAKEELLADGDNKAAREMLMAKLWEFRQWHYDSILRKTQAHPDIGKAGLEEWKAAGSTTLTSDIDVNLKGNKTERAVAVFNKLFKEDGWEHEAGVVYDVNVYAVDFMHKDTFKGLAEMRAGVIESHSFTPDDAATRVSAKEGKRTGKAGGGVSGTSKILEERMLKADADLQRVWSLVKMRLYMTGEQWTAYVRDAEVAPDIQNAVNLRYDSYMTTLKEKMLTGMVDVDLADEATSTGFQVLESAGKAVEEEDGIDPEEVKMAASNRIYEEKLMEMAAVRETVAKQIKQYEDWIKEGNVEDAEALDAAIDGNLAILRDLISECAMYSNEAYVTDGAVNHTVVGLQSKIGISQTRAESMDAFNENVGDSLKEIRRHSKTMGEAAYKAGKYLWRMADAALNIGSKSKDIRALYDAGYAIANEIKGGDDTQLMAENKAAAALTKYLPPGAAANPERLMAYVRSVAARVAKQHAADLAANGLKRAEPTKFEKRPDPSRSVPV